MCGISGHLGVTSDEVLVERLARCHHPSPAAHAVVARVGSAVLAVTRADGDAGEGRLATSVSGRPHARARR